jgi:hypothetical protein
MPNLLVFEALQSKDHMNACRYALLKYLQLHNLKPPPDIQVMVYTDRPMQLEAFSPFFPFFQMKEISTREIKAWQGPRSVPGRLQLQIVREVLAHVDCNLVYCTPATYITRPLDPVFNEIGAGRTFLLGPLPKSATFRTAKLSSNGKPLPLTAGAALWDASAVGLSSRFSYIAEEATEVIDGLDKPLKKEFAGPAAISYAFEKQGEPQPLKDYILQYRNFTEFYWLLDQFFTRNAEESIPNLVRLAHHLDACTLREGKKEFQNLPLLRKIARTLTGKQWSIRQFDKKT